ncbi:hypothetical protein EEW87_16365 [Janibacter melonis]|uniref:Uncharacterized protein n=1 Tax=Janibacter melonis TaxID=262209 RepID=A0A650GE64_9MICO|nr:hypothetical protein [Janibacter melonis]QGX08245.1 hypothetical protein EEW87_16365 [Janibacter melonis]
MDLSVVASGTTVEALKAVRDAIVRDLETCESMRDRAALYLRLSDVLGRIEILDPAAPAADPIDEVATRRRKRRGAAS